MTKCLLALCRNRATLARLRSVLVATIVLALLVTASVQRICGQEAAEGDRVRLQFDQGTELRVLIQLVSTRLNVNILYDEETAKKRVNIRAPAEMPVELLMDLLQSVLRMHNMVLVESEVAGWKRIVKAQDLTGLANTGEVQEVIRENGRAAPMTQVFELEYATPAELKELIEPFLVTVGSSITEIQKPPTLIITDSASNIARLEQMIARADQPRKQIVTQYYQARFVEAATLSAQLQAILSSRRTAEGVEAAQGNSQDGSSGTISVGTTQVSFDERTNRIILIGTVESIEEARQLIKSLDVPLGLKTELYALRYVSPERLDQLIQELIGPIAASRLYRSAIDVDGNQLIVTTTPEIHQRLGVLRQTLDVPTAANARQSPIRFYKLRYTTAADVLRTLLAIESGQPPPNPEDQYPELGRFESRDGLLPVGPNRPPAAPGREAPLPPAMQNEATQYGPGYADAMNSSAGITLQGAPARITADENSNTLIVIAEPAVQPIYEELIKKLDRRRAQVLVEATVVILDTSGDFALGVEIAARNSSGDRKFFAFNSFGLSTVDATTGSLSLIPGLGFNGTVVNADVADIVLRALTTHRRGKVMSSAKVLVNDNSTGILTSVAEVPYASINASQTVATTSFAGFAEAGTTIEVTPHVSDDESLQLDYRLVLNAFTGTGADGLPPPRQTEEIKSIIAIPDGHTAIVGGLTNRNHGDSVESIPILEKVPIVKYLVRNTDAMDSSKTLFVFIRPIILKDDKFQHLKFISDREKPLAGVKGEFPASGPMVIR